MADELMTIEELSGYLKLTELNILNLIQKNEIPAIRIENQWRFLRPVIDDWILSKMNYKKMNYNDISQMKLTSFFDKEFILSDIKRGNKNKY